MEKLFKISFHVIYSFFFFCKYFEIKSISRVENSELNLTLEKKKTFYHTQLN
jgi:hypothetical protein